MSDESNPYVIGPSPYDEETLQRLYNEEDRTIAEVADELDRDPTTIQSWLDDFRIEREPRVRES